MISSDVDLLAQWRHGDTGAANALLGRHFVTVFRYFDSNVPAAEVEDLTQRTFEACVRSRDRIREDASFRGYLIGIARNVLYKHIRARSSRPKVGPLSGLQLADSEPTPSGYVVHAIQREAFLSAVAALPDEFRDVVLLYYWHDHDIRDIAPKLGIPIGTVKSRLHRSRHLLRRSIERVSADAIVASQTLRVVDSRAIH